MLDRRVLLLAIGICTVAEAGARAEGDAVRRGSREHYRRDHEGARSAFQRGEIRSLGEILVELRSQLEGEVIEVELKRESGTYVYEFKILTSAGRVSEVEVDAATGKVIKKE